MIALIGAEEEWAAMALTDQRREWLIGIVGEEMLDRLWDGDSKPLCMLRLELEGKVVMRWVLMACRADYGALVGVCEIPDTEGIRLAGLLLEEAWKVEKKGVQFVCDPSFDGSGHTVTSLLGRKTLEGL
jgi:hypothetical protein